MVFTFFFPLAIILHVRYIGVEQPRQFHPGMCMLGGIIMQQQLLRQISVGESDSLSYYLLENLETIGNGESHMGYGIRVREDTHCIDAVVCDISPNRDYTQSLLYQLADYEVYPVHLQDVVSEMIG